MGLPIRRALIWGVGSMGLHVFIMWIWWHQPLSASSKASAENIFQVQLVGQQVEGDAESQNEFSFSDKEGDSFTENSFANQQEQRTDAPPPMPEIVYTSGSELEQRPYPKAPVIVPYPDAVLGKQSGSVTLVLFIDLNGAVEHVDIDRSDVTPEFERAAVEAFQHAQMYPGIKDGRPTKAKTKILVEFELK